MTKSVYIVKGSEDGNLGVFSSKKKAIECAKVYCGDDCDVEVRSWGTTVYGRSCSADVEEYELNQYHL